MNVEYIHMKCKIYSDRNSKWKFYAQKKAEYKEMQVKYILNFIKCFNYSKYRYTCRWKEG